MSYYGSLKREQIIQAENIKRNIISALNEEFAVIREKYDYARKHGISLKEKEYRLKLLDVSGRLKKIESMRLPDILRKYSRFVHNLQNDFKGDFELERSQTANILFFLIILSAVAFARFFNEKAVLAFILIAGVLAIFYSTTHKNPPQLVAVKA